MRPRALAALVLVTLLAGLVTLVLAWRHGRPIEISRSEVVRLELRPVPEGPVAVFERRPSKPYARSLRLLEDHIPVPLPGPLRQPLTCSYGGNMVIELTDGRVVTYGPCRRPRAIERLWDVAASVYSRT